MDINWKYCKQRGEAMKQMLSLILKFTLQTLSNIDLLFLCIQKCVAHISIFCPLSEAGRLKGNE